MQRQTLTDTQERYFEWIKAYIDREGRSPTIREIMAGMYYKSPAPVQQALASLEKKGWIKRREGQPRNISIVGQRRVAMSTKACLLLKRFEFKCLENGHDFEKALHERLSV